MRDVDKTKHEEIASLTITLILARWGPVSRLTLSLNGIDSAQHVPLPVSSFWEVELVFSLTDAVQGRTVQITTGRTRRSPNVNGYHVRWVKGAKKSDPAFLEVGQLLKIVSVTGGKVKLKGGFEFHKLLHRLEPQRAERGTPPLLHRLRQRLFCAA